MTEPIMITEENEARAEADKAIYWLLQLYCVVYKRQGWEPGMTEGEVASRVVSFLANRELDPADEYSVGLFLREIEAAYKVIS